MLWGLGYIGVVGLLWLVFLCGEKFCNDLCFGVVVMRVMWYTD